MSSGKADGSLENFRPFNEILSLFLTGYKAFVCCYASTASQISRSLPVFIRNSSVFFLKQKVLFQSISSELAIIVCAGLN